VPGDRDGLAGGDLVKEPREMGLGFVGADVPHMVLRLV
jgi:hypothetical protein